jgi:hypothetical protein
MSTATVTIPSDTIRTSAYFQPTALGVAVLTASEIDFFKGSANLDVTDVGDGGPAEGDDAGLGTRSLPMGANLGCGCSSTWGSAWVFVALVELAGLLARERRQAEKAG